MSASSQYRTPTSAKPTSGASSTPWPAGTASRRYQCDLGMPKHAGGRLSPQLPNERAWCRADRAHGRPLPGRRSDGASSFLKCRAPATRYLEPIRKMIGNVLALRSRREAHSEAPARQLQDFGRDVLGSMFPSYAAPVVGRNVTERARRGRCYSPRGAACVCSSPTSPFSAPPVCRRPSGLRPRWCPGSWPSGLRSLRRWLSKLPCSPGISDDARRSRSRRASRHWALPC